MSQEIYFEPIRWDSRSIVLRTNLKYRKASGSRIERALRARLPERALDVHFRFNRPLEVSGSALATAASTLCGRQYSRIDFKFPVSEETRKNIEGWTGAHVEAESEEARPQPRHNGAVLLNFSGGFDSLASRYLLPESHELISLDLGGRFARERKFFRQFDPLIVKTNITDTPLRANSWSFLGIGSILAAESLRGTYCTFGAILEATLLQRGTPFERNNTFPPFAAVGLCNAPAAQGLSEIGTLLILEHFAPELIGESLGSLAGPREEKQVRKWALVEALRSYAGIEGGPLEGPVFPDAPHYRVGENFVVDLSALAVAWLGRPDLTRLMVRDAEHKLIPAAKSLDLGFMLKADKRMYANYPGPLKGRLAEQLNAAGIEWYSPADEQSCEEVRQFIESLACES